MFGVWSAEANGADGPVPAADTTAAGAGADGDADRGAAAASARAAVAVLAGRLVGATGLLRRRIRRGAGRPWPAAELTEAQTELLRHVRRNPGTSVTDAAAALGLAANTVSTLVGRLVELGLMRREADPGDRRVARLTLTADALATVRAWRDRRGALVAVALGELDAADRAAIATALPALERLAERIERGVEQ